MMGVLLARTVFPRPIAREEKEKERGNK